MATDPERGGGKGSLSSRHAKSDDSQDIFQHWEDVPFEPLPQNHIICIDFSDYYRKVFGLLGAARRRAERSERCLRLTEAAIWLNPADFTTWQFREETAEALAVAHGVQVWERELAFTANVIMESPKNYQAWGYRRRVAKELEAYDAEVMFVEVALARDEKNYHAWAHRQWLVRQGFVCPGEMEMIQWYIDDDVRNNSAWNHAWLITKGLDVHFSQEHV